MVIISINSNDAGQRLDRFLRKYLIRAPLSAIYKIIRKDLKLNGKRVKEDRVLSEGDELTLYISEEKLKELTRKPKDHKAKRQFGIAYEDDDILIVEKPWGLLTHGDSNDKKNTLMNQVCGYLQDKGEYDPAGEKSFTPSPVNRLDRNTTGLVIFGKTGESLRQLTALIRKRDGISKYYLTIVAGDFSQEMVIEDALIKNQETNRVRISDQGQSAKSIARPLRRRADGKYSVVEVELVTGRTHQIRVHLAGKGYPLVGDSKYGIRVRCASTQLLHAYKLKFGEIKEEYSKLTGLSGLEVKAEIPEDFERVWKEL
ncbi:MAG: RluA family pseudouridine synthase [Eubacteriales bacterium]|nr:RluA family pseudouridine synthase [Eubacteriales bacterium]